MRLLKKAAHPDGTIEVKVSVGSTEDLWHLYNFILPGDSVRTKTRRKITKENAMGSQKAEMHTLTLEILVKQIDFTPEEIRLQGTNCTETNFVKMGAHHTLTVHPYPPQDVTIIKKEWDEVADERLKDACHQEAKADTAAVLMDFGVAHILLVTSSFIHFKATINVTISKKHKNDGTARDRSIQRFFKQVLDTVLSHIDFEKIKVLLIGSPGHVREEFLEYARRACQAAEQGPLKLLQTNMHKALLVKVNATTTDGLREALADPVVAQKMEATKASSDIRVWQKFQTTMNENPDCCVYTPQFVYHAALAGAISHLMMSDAVFRSPEPVERRFFLSLYHFTKRTGASVNVFSSNHVTGVQLVLLGHVAAVLYFPVEELDEMEVVPDFLHTDEIATFIRENAASSITV